MKVSFDRKIAGIFVRQRLSSYFCRFTCFFFHTMQESISSDNLLEKVLIELHFHVVQRYSKQNSRTRWCCINSSVDGGATFDHYADFKKWWKRRHRFFVCTIWGKLSERYFTVRNRSMIVWANMTITARVSIFKYLQQLCRSAEISLVANS